MARWRGHLDHLLAKPSRLRSVRHFPALAYRDVPAFMAQLRERDASVALALQFICLTAVRAQECLGMTWGEVDLEARLWVIPAHRMKARREHRVPLSDQAIKVLKLRQNLGSVQSSNSARPFPISLRTIDGLRRQVSLPTTHGLRSSFEDLGCGMHVLSPRANRAVLGTCDRLGHRVGLHAQRCAGAAPRADGRLGRITHRYRNRVAAPGRIVTYARLFRLYEIELDGTFRRTINERSLSAR